MKNLSKKFLGMLLVLLTVISCFSGCINNSVFHSHKYKLKSNESGHFMECSCGEVKDSAEHTFDWVVDVEPTYTAPGYKHKECGVCGYDTNECITTERLLREGVITDKMVDPSLRTFESFSDQYELQTFYNENKDKINAKFLYLNTTFDQEKGLHIEWPNKVNYYFNYESENNNQYTDCCITTYAGIYSEELGTDTDITKDVPYHSITLELVSNEFYTEVDNIYFEFHSFNSTIYMWDYVVKIYNDNDCIGCLYYYSGLDINREWLAAFLLENLIVLNNS